MLELVYVNIEQDILVKVIITFLEKVDGGIPGLKLHQIGLHINPYYLSASDRILAQISSYAVHTDKTEGPWIPDWDTFKVKLHSYLISLDNRQNSIIFEQIFREVYT